MTKQKKNKSQLPSLNSERMKHELIQTKNAIRKKFRELHNEKQALNEHVNEVYKPIIEPLRSLANENKKILNNEAQSNSHSNEIIQPMGTIYKSEKPSRSKFYQNDSNIIGISRISNDDDEDISFHSVKNETIENDLRDRILSEKSQTIDALYGIHSRNGELVLGNDHITVKNDGSKLKYSVKRKDFPLTQGLSDLLLMTNPKSYTKSDLAKYKKMLLLTSAHKVNFISDGKVRRDIRSRKYRRVIKTLFPSRKKLGYGFSEKPQIDFKTVDKTGNVNYTYWDDPNELVDRLRLLISSQEAGHTGHNNEIISIITVHGSAPRGAQNRF